MPCSVRSFSLSVHKVISGLSSNQLLRESVASWVILIRLDPPLGRSVVVPLASNLRMIPLAVLAATPNVRAAAAMETFVFECRYWMIRSCKSLEIVCLRALCL